ncbi:biotin transporter BioY [Sporosarcina sp. BI001-red]|uniref:biotin transporter BioY n=1 Tax=Sporosarcina sp. BI001-red TaxID=2282866 RepID=UPI000E22837C|nr:biotin transporter BioY [Sporosarcina sp. BI001-red]REB08073.1 biotin transporter BioY [Sporosarcina sp. BI001-red]
MTRGNSIHSMALIAVFASLTAIGAFIKITLPVVPFTLQIVIVFLAGTLLGSSRGLQSQLVYLFVGLAGLPVFTKGGGITYLLQPTFGYLIGFAAAAYVIGLILERVPVPTRKHFILANLAGTAVIYAIGVPYLYVALNSWLATPANVMNVLVAGFFSTIVIDIALAVGTGLLATRLYPILKKFTHTKRGLRHELENTRTRSH